MLIIIQIDNFNNYSVQFTKVLIQFETKHVKHS